MDFSSGSSGRTPSRAPRPEVPQRASEALKRAGETAPHVSEPPRQTAHASHKTRSRKKIPIIIGTILLVLLLAGAAWTLLKGADTNGTIDSGKYQAVFFSNGQVYFGKLHNTGGEYMTLTEVFYLQAEQTEETDEKADPKNPQTTNNDEGNVQLIKLGNEVHGPEDKMIISKNQVLFFENLKPDGKVAKTIEQYKKQ